MILTNHEKSLIITSKLKVDKNTLILNHMDYLIDEKASLPTDPKENWRYKTQENKPNLALYQEVQCDRSNTCSDISGLYHGICNKIWDKNCTKNLSVKELYYIKNMAENCKTLRETYQKDCCGGRVDPGHMKAIKYIEKKGQLCELELFNRGMRE